MPEIIDFTKVGGVFKDTGEGDIDFYTYWFSICYSAGMLNVFRRIFRDIDQYEQIARRFLISRGIAVKNDATLNELKYLYANWEKEIEKRGTKFVTSSLCDSSEVGLSNYALTGVVDHDISVNSGIGILSNTQFLEGGLTPQLNIGYRHIIQFDTVLIDSNGVQYNCGGAEGGYFCFGGTSGIYIENLTVADEEGIASYKFGYRCGGVDYFFTTDVNVKVLNTLKFIRNSTHLYFYINGIYIGATIVGAYDAYVAYYLFQQNLPAIGNISISVRDSNFWETNLYLWSCNEGSGYVVESNHAPDYSAILNISSGLSWGDVWCRNELFNNTEYVGIDGELKRLIDYKFGEFLFELLASGEMGFCIDMSSPISEEASCLNLNKAYEKGVVTCLSKYPLMFNSAVHPIIHLGYICNVIPTHTTEWFGINAAIKDMAAGLSYLDFSTIKPAGLIPFIPIPVATTDDELDGYEISFVINSTTNIQLQFGLLTFDADLKRVALKTKSYLTHANTDLFLGDSNFSYCKNQDLWIRGTYSLSELTDVADKLNINLGNNLYNDSVDVVKYIVPVIAFKAVVDVDTTVKLKDIVVRPLSLNTSKGIVCNKNIIAGYLKNESGQTQETVERFVSQKLIPYNCDVNIQYL